MRITIAQRHCTVSAEVLTRTEELLQKLTRYEPRVGMAEVVYSEEKHGKHIEVILHVDGAAPIIANGEESEFRTALDKAVDRLSRMLKKQRSQHRDHKAPKWSEASAE